MSFLKRIPAPTEGVRLRQPDTEAVLGGQGLGTGSFYIAESRLSWIETSGLGFSLDYPIISLHAISRDLSAYPWEHLYVMVNAKFEEESKESCMGEEEEEEEGGSDDELEPISEFRFVPSDKSALEAMFSAMCECQALHPDPEDEDSDNYDGEEYDVEAHEMGQGDIPSFYTYEEGLSRLTAEGQATLERLEGMLAQSISTQYHMAGVRTEDSVRDFEDGMEVDTAPAVAGQFEDADVDH
ncbi:methylosome subunit pICln isoform X2 [Rhineura floridana]|uniref:methylosome subunit pICln isoform X2 n=1 Tax=Rhineura floridana TaxID=261503 RepID=UPI002AC7EFAA|nr:methylosome subunit pICln isoform X2 [Rhineura floridana]